MKKNQINSSKILLLLVLGGMLFSCTKSTKEARFYRKTLVQILGGGTPATVVTKAIDFVPQPVQLLVVDLRRDPIDEAGLFSTMNVVIKDDTAAVKAANSSYVHLPAAWYTIQSEVPKVGGLGGTFSFVFKPSDFAKQIYITIPDATLLNPSVLYGLAFTITSVDADGAISKSKSVVLVIGAKNIYDGRYFLKGIHNRPGVGVDFPYLVQMDMVTTGANSVVFYWKDISAAWPGVNSVGHPIGTGPDPTQDAGWYGPTVAPEVEFNPATNLVIDVRNTNSSGPPISIYSGAGSGQGRYEPATKSMYVYFRYNANDLRGFMDTLTYIGSR